MSGDEVFATIVSVAVAAVAWIGFAVWTTIFTGRLTRLGTVMPIVVSAAGGMLALWLILETVASHDVRDDPRYLGMYSLMGLAWIGIVPRLTFFGVSLRDDVLERNNVSASHALAGFAFGSMLCFAGGNIGDGPGWWVVVVCASLAQAAMLVSWILVNQFVHLADRITIDRDPAIGLRVGGCFVGLGVIFGRAVAGNWSSFTETVADFGRHSFPALFLVTALIFFEGRSRPRYHPLEHGIVVRGIIPALLYIAGGIAVLLTQGKIE